MHILKDARIKLDNKTSQYIFLGYAYEKWGSMLIDPTIIKVHQSGYGVFFKD